MSLKVSSRGTIPPFIVMDVMQEAAEREAGGSVVHHLEVGQPGTAAPSGVLERARQALDSERLGYTVALGIPGLTRAIADHYRSYYGVGVDPCNATPGAGVPAFFAIPPLVRPDGSEQNRNNMSILRNYAQGEDFILGTVPGSAGNSAGQPDSGPNLDDINTIADFLEHPYSDFLIDEIVFSQKNLELGSSLGFFNSMSSDQWGGKSAGGCGGLLVAA